MVGPSTVCRSYRGPLEPICDELNVRLTRSPLRYGAISCDFSGRSPVSFPLFGSEPGCVCDHMRGNRCCKDQSETDESEAGERRKIANNHSGKSQRDRSQKDGFAGGMQLCIDFRHPKNADNAKRHDNNTNDDQCVEEKGSHALEHFPFTPEPGSHNRRHERDERQYQRRVEVVRRFGCRRIENQK